MQAASLCCFCATDVKVAFNAAKWFYFSLLTISAILTWIFRDYADEVLERLPELAGCKGESDMSICVGKAAVLRFSFATFSFHAVHALLLVQTKYVEDPRTVFHTALHGLKFLGWIGLVVVSFLIPNDFYAVYGEIARVASGLFLVFQAIIIIDFVYQINALMLDRKECISLLVVGTGLCYGLFFTMIGLSYHFYAPRGSCSTNIFFVTWTLILAIAVTLISISKWRIEEAGLFTSGAVVSYSAYLLVSALNSEPSALEGNSCVAFGGMGDRWISVLAFLLALGAVIISTMTAGVTNVLDNSSKESDAEDLPYRPDFFHLIFALAAMYLAMLFTGWSLDGTEAELSLDKGWHSAWVKIASQWLVFLLYTWTMVAPKLLSERSFD